jgi:hypothetical protein
MRWHA